LELRKLRKILIKLLWGISCHRTSLRTAAPTNKGAVTVRLEMPLLSVTILRTLFGRHESIPRNVLRDRSCCG